MPIEDLSVVIRTTQERTLGLCRRLIAEQLGYDGISVVEEAPASQMVRRTHETGMESGLPWLLAVDADVLIAEGAIDKLYEMAMQTPDHVFLILGYAQDKFAGGPRTVGLQLFRTAFCRLALDNIPDESVMRPDSHIRLALKNAGHPHVQTHVVVGLHDYYQYYRDLYRKGFKYAKKWRRMIPLFESFWTRMADQDPDYRVALWGLRAGQIYDGSVAVDVSKYPQELDTMLRHEGLEEKRKLPADAISGEEVAASIAKHSPPPEYYDFMEIESTTTRWGRFLGRLKREGLQKTGPTMFVPWLLGAALKRSGTLIMNRAIKAS